MSEEEKFIRVVKVARSNTVHLPLEALRRIGIEPYAGGRVEVWVRGKEVVLRPYRPEVTRA